MQSERRTHVVSTRLTETDSQTLHQWCDLTMRCPGDLLNTVLKRVLKLRREHRSSKSLEGFVHRLELRSLVANRGGKKPKAVRASRRMPKGAQGTSRRAAPTRRSAE